MNLTALLLDTERPVLASEIQREVPGYPESQAAFRRAFERDKEDLREMGIPISVEATAETEPPVDGYRIHKQDYYLDDPGLEPEELAAIHLATLVVRFEGGSSQEALWKLGGVHGDTTTTEELAAIPSPPFLPRLFAALAERRVVHFRYSGLEREVEPRRLDFLRGHWYLSGFDRSRDAARHFRLDRIDGDVTLDPQQVFEHEETNAPGLRLEPWQLGDAEPVVARLQVDSGWADEARRRLGAASEVDTRPDGAAIFEVAVSNSDGFRNFVLGFLEHAEILGPPALRREFVTWLEAATAR